MSNYFTSHASQWIMYLFNVLRWVQGRKVSRALLVLYYWFEKERWSIHCMDDIVFNLTLQTLQKSEIKASLNMYILSDNSLKMCTCSYQAKLSNIIGRFVLLILTLKRLNTSNVSYFKIFWYFSLHWLLAYNGLIKVKYLEKILKFSKLHVWSHWR